MNFKELMRKDLDSTFFNESEFSQKYKWGNSFISAIVDDERMLRKYASEFETLGQGSHLVYVAMSQLKKIPRIDDVVNFQNNIYTIDEVKEEDGMYAIFMRLGRV